MESEKVLNSRPENNETEIVPSEEARIDLLRLKQEMRKAKQRAEKKRRTAMAIFIFTTFLIILKYSRTQVQETKIFLDFGQKSLVPGKSQLSIFLQM